jgi:hypothetical protein
MTADKSKDLTTIDDLEGDRPLYYKPEEYDDQPRALVSECLGYELAETKFGTRAAYLGRDREGRIWSRLIVGKALVGQFRQRRPAPGEWTRIEYLGVRVSQSGPFQGKDYHGWEVRVARPPQVPNWSKFDLETGAAELQDVRPQDPLVIEALEAEEATISQLAGAGEDDEAAREDEDYDGAAPF